MTIARMGLSMVGKLKCVPTLAGGEGLVRAYYLDSGMLGMMTLAKLMRMPLINLPACSLV